MKNNLFGKLSKFYFSIVKNTQKATPTKELMKLRDKREKLKNNKVFEGMNGANKNELKINKEEIYYPMQNPRLVDNKDSEIVSYRPPTIDLSIRDRIPPSIYFFEEREFESPIDSLSLEVGILGPPNAGKSSLVNSLVSEDISAVSSKYGTTYETIEGVYTEIDTKVQLILKDTPGATKVMKNINNKKIITRAWSIIPDCDQLIFLVDGVKHLDIVTKEAIKRLLSHRYKPSLLSFMTRMRNMKDLDLEELIRMQGESMELDKDDHEARSISTILVMNKVDLVTSKRRLKSLQEELEDIGAFDKVFHISCSTGYGIDELKSYLKDKALRRNWKYHAETKSNLSVKDKCEQTLKGLIFDRFYKEIPYNCLPLMRSFVPKSNGEISIYFEIEVKYKDQLIMFLGKQARILTALKLQLNLELSKLLHKPVDCFITVSTRKHKKDIETLNTYPKELNLY